MFSQHALVINIMMNRLLRQMILLQCHGDFSFFREISFAAFLISGILGSVNYYKSGNLDLKRQVCFRPEVLSARLPVSRSTF